MLWDSVLRLYVCPFDIMVMTLTESMHSRSGLSVYSWPSELQLTRSTALARLRLRVRFVRADFAASFAYAGQLLRRMDCLHLRHRLLHPCFHRSEDSESPTLHLCLS